MKIPFSRAMLSIAIPLFLTVVGCAPTYTRGYEATSYVRGPHGEPAVLLRCRGDASTCVQMASNACPTGYVVHGMGAAPSRYRDYYYRRDHTRHRGAGSFMFISCTADPAEERAQARCDDAYSGTESFGAYWTARRGQAERRRDFPSVTEFSTTCRGLPTRLQHCMQTAYRDAHHDQCETAVSELAIEDRKLIDALFFERPALAGSRAGE